MDADSEAQFRKFVDEKSAALMRTAYLLTGDQQHAEDLLQEVLASLVRRWSNVHMPEAYVRRSLYRRQVSRWRRLGKRGEVLPANLPDNTVPDHASTSAERLTVVAALRRLTPAQRAVLVLRYLEDMSEKEAARVLGCSIGTVRSQTHKALSRLRALAPELAQAANEEVTT